MAMPCNFYEAYCKGFFDDEQPTYPTEPEEEIEKIDNQILALQARRKQLKRKAEMKADEKAKKAKENERDAAKHDTCS